MAWRYLSYHRAKTIILVLSLTVILFLPAALRTIVSRSADALTQRADATPLLVGAKGSALELVLNSLYFDADPPQEIRYDQLSRISDTGLALPVPLHARFHAQGHRIVGTSLDYFDFRGVSLTAGRKFATLGECVVGARVAREQGWSVGSSVISSPESVFDLAGVYPLKMLVVGVLAPTGAPDDEAVFVDVKTAWIIEGLGHGHQDLERREAASAVLSRDEDRIVANASLVQYNEITPQNQASFHFHGNQSDYPLTAILAVPPDAKSGVILQGRYQGEDEVSQIVRPSDVMDELLGTVLTVQRFVIATILLVGVSTLATATLVFLLSLRLRKREIQTMVKLGGSRSQLFWLMTAEILTVLFLATTLAAGLTVATRQFGEQLLRAFLA